MKNLYISLNSSGNNLVNRFRNLVNDCCKEYNQIIVDLKEPGIRYSEGDSIYSFIDLIEENIDKNIIYYGCNFFNLSKQLPLKFVNYMFHCGPDLYKNNTMCKDLLEHCIPFYKKSKNFKKWDFLMGGSSPTKDYLYENIKNHNTFSQTFLTYYRNDTKKGYWSNFVKVPKNHTAETIYNRFESMLRFSDLIDPEIYNQTFFTALIETCIHPDFGVFTEKTAKPIIAKRPFVVFGSVGQLRALRELGFKTFSPVIDEDYDMITNERDRFKKVLDSMQELSRQDPFVVYEKLKEVLDHNKKHFEENDWNSSFLRQIKNCDKKIDLNSFTI